MICRLRHRWNIGPREAIALQRKLSTKVVRRGRRGIAWIRHIAGIDISVKDDRARAAVVILRFPSLEPVETRTAERAVPFPYIPGLLSFREIPAIMDAARRIRTEPDLLMVDGHGIAHQRRFGIAAHLGVLYDIPSIGCAKSLLIGEYVNPEPEKGAWNLLRDGKEAIGAVVRTRNNVKPIFVSIGHRISLVGAVRIVLACGMGYRLPQPTRLAHMTAGCITGSS